MMDEVVGMGVPGKLGVELALLQAVRKILPLIVMAKTKLRMRLFAQRAIDILLTWMRPTVCDIIP